MCSIKILYLSSMRRTEYTREPSLTCKGKPPGRPKGWARQAEGEWGVVVVVSNRWPWRARPKGPWMDGKHFLVPSHALWQWGQTGDILCCILPALEWLRRVGNPSSTKAGGGSTRLQSRRGGYHLNNVAAKNQPLARAKSWGEKSPPQIDPKCLGTFGRTFVKTAKNYLFKALEGKY